MLAIDWRFWEIFSTAFLVLVASILGFTFAARIARGSTRWGLRLVCVPVGLMSSLAVLLMIAGLGCERSSALIYSPSRRMAARVVSIDGGATDGNTFVMLIWADGFRRSAVFTGAWGSVEPSDVRWKNDESLVVPYQGQIQSCESTSAVTVLCVPKGQTLH